MPQPLIDINQINSSGSNLVSHSSVTITGGSGLTGGGDITVSRVLSHADTSSQANVNNSGNNFIQDVTLDGFGHVTGLTTAAVSLPSNTGFGNGQTWQTGLGRSINTTYTNTTGRSIMVAVTASGAGGGTFLVGGISILVAGSGDAVTFIVENGMTYRYNSSFGPPVWTELR